MQAKGPKHERETIINFNEEEDMASVWTASAMTYRKLKQHGYNPVADNERSASFEIRKQEIRLPRPRKKSTPEQAAARARGLELARSALRVAKNSRSNGGGNSEGGIGN